MSRHGAELESQMVLKRPRREDQLAPRLQAPMSMVPRIQGIDFMPTIRGVHEHMSTWMSSLISAQDGCLQAVAHRASMGRSQQEHLAHQAALRSTMPSTTNQVAYLRAQLALRDAQIEQVKAERDNHFVQEEEVLAHMRLLSSEAKDWKSRVVTEAEKVLCRESAQMAQQATEAQEAMDQHYKAKWQQAEADLTALCQSNSVQVQSFASKMHETNAEHQKLHDAQERRIHLQAQALREAHQYEQQAAQTAQEYQDMIHELRPQADEQPDMQKLLWKRQLSQQADYRAEIHELHTELLNSLQAEARDGFYLKNSRLRTGQLHRVYNHLLVLQFNSVQVRSRENTVFPLQVTYHQLNGETSMVEQEMMVVNYLVLYLRVKSLMYPFAHKKQSNIQMN